MPTLATIDVDCRNANFTKIKNLEMKISRFFYINILLSFDVLDSADFLRHSTKTAGADVKPYFTTSIARIYFVSSAKPRVQSVPTI